ncbi:MAG TPA: ThiF family adenylyltransferase [Bryobacterales bacterium]|nr:ThiF family adenylyltransferase [Bryobacterales bacterium]
MYPADREKYSRQILFPPLGEQGQEKLLRSRAVIVGCGALGSVHANALARAGVGEIVIIDRDYVEPSNLQRQWLFDEADAAEALPKAVAAARKLAAINSSIVARPVVADLTPPNAEELLLPADVILDGTDNFDTRYLINDVALKHGVSWIYGAAVGSAGFTMPILPGVAACLSCLFPEPPSGLQPTCDTAGVLNAITALIASLQVADAIKILCGRSEDVEPRLLSIDVWKNTWRSISTRERSPDCPACAQRRFVHLEGAERPPISLCGRNSVQIHARSSSIDLRALGESLRPLGPVRSNEYALRFLCSPYEMTVFPDGRAIIKGTTDIGVARSLYARYVGA